MQDNGRCASVVLGQVHNLFLTRFANGLNLFASRVRNWTPWSEKLLANTSWLVTIAFFLSFCWFNSRMSSTQLVIYRPHAVYCCERLPREIIQFLQDARNAPPAVSQQQRRWARRLRKTRKLDAQDAEKTSIQLKWSRNKNVHVQIRPVSLSPYATPTEQKEHANKRSRECEW